MFDTQIATVIELEQGSPVGGHVAGVELVAVAAGNTVSVLEGRCPHQGTLLSEGYVDDGRLVCRAHGWRFDCATGVRDDDAAACLHQFSVAVDGDRVLVDSSEVAAWAARSGQMPTSESQNSLLTIDQLPGPRSLPLVGNAHQIRTTSFHLILEDWYRQYGDLYQVKLGARRVIVIADPDMVQQILRERPDTFARSAEIRRTIAEVGIEGLFSAEGEQWRRHRRIVMDAFDASHLRGFYPVMASVTQRLHDRWQRLAEQGSPFEAQKELMRYTVDITSNLAFGYDMNTLEEGGDQIQQHLERIFPMIGYRAFMPVRHWNYIKSPADRALDNALAELRTFADQFIDKARRQLDEEPGLKERPQNLLQALLAAQGDDEIELSDSEIYGNVFTFLLAGEDTTANTMAWMLYFMAKHPEVLRRMQAEADTVLGETKTAADYATMGQFRYIEAVAHETMRFKPVAPFLGIHTLKDVTIGRLQIPAETQLFVLLRPKGLEKSEFADAAEFRPERWLDYAVQDNPHHRKSFLPFGAGPRLCPGRSLALLEIKMAMGMICRSFDVVRADPDREIEEKFVFTVMPKELMIALRPRSDESL